MSKIGYYSATGSDLIILGNALDKFIDEKGNVFEISAKNKKDLLHEEDRFKFIEYVSTVDMLIICLHGGKESCPCFDELIEVLPKKSKVFVHPTSATDIDIALENSTVGDEIWKKLFKYFSYSGIDNFYNMLLFLSNILFNTNFTFEKPKPLPWQGIYHPEFLDVPTLEEYLEKKYDDSRPTVGIWFHRTQWVNKNTDYMDKIIKQIESKGANAIAIFCNSRRDDELGSLGTKEVIQEFFMKEGKPLIDVLINMMSFSSTMMDTEESASMFTELGVPVIKGILSSNKKEDWKNSFQGLNPIEISISIAMPEFDGDLISVPVAFSDIAFIDPLTGAKINKYVSEEERIEKIVNLSLNWAKLKYIPNSEKKVAIIFHNYPPKNHCIGTALGLDSPVSVLNILKEMDNRGYKIDKMPEDGQELISEIISKATNDRNYLSTEQLYQRAVSTVPLETYNKWFGKLSKEIREDMIKTFENPPGQMFNYKDELIIPGIINGNIFIGMQPPRGYLESSADLHSPDLPMPHHYYAYYEWIRDVFKADAVMHIGKHGSLEWLPGKSAGLSKDCYPEIAIGDLPNIYPYIINNPGEGTQAKRRSYC